MRMRASKVVACAAIAAIGGPVLGLRIAHLVQFDNAALARAAVERTQNSYRQELCLFRAIRKEVPRGAGVYLAGNNEAYFQRLAELSTLWVTPEEDQRAAQWTLTITKVTGSHQAPLPSGTRHFRCYNNILVARPI